MPSLKSVKFGYAAFKYCSRVVFESDGLDLPALETIELGTGAFAFNDKDESDTLILRSSATIGN